MSYRDHTRAGALLRLAEEALHLVEARDLNEAIQVASRLPSAPLGTVEVRPCRDLEVGGVAHKASSKQPDPIRRRT